MCITLLLPVYISSTCNAHDEHVENTNIIQGDIGGGQHKALYTPELPDNPVNAVAKTKNPPVDSSIRYEKIRDMSLNRLHEARLYYLWDDNIDVAIRAIQRILTLEEDQNQAAYHMIELGDLYRHKSDYANAKTVYDTFLNLYPGSIYVEQVYQRLFLCHEQSLLDPDRDQTETRAMISRARTYLDIYGDYGMYADKAHELLNYAHQLLCQSELHICDFYINKYTYAGNAASLRSAYYRFKYMYDNVIAMLPQKQSQQAATILAQALQHIAIDTLDDNDKEQKDALYRQLCQTRDEMHGLFAPRNTWRINPLHRF